jgi:hypothetical protein
MTQDTSYVHCVGNQMEEESYVNLLEFPVTEWIVKAC